MKERTKNNDNKKSSAKSSKIDESSRNIENKENREKFFKKEKSSKKITERIVGNPLYGQKSKYDTISIHFN